MSKRKIYNNSKIKCSDLILKVVSNQKIKITVSDHQFILKKHPDSMKLIKLSKLIYLKLRYLLCQSAEVIMYRKRNFYLNYVQLLRNKGQKIKMMLF